MRGFRIKVLSYMFSAIVLVSGMVSPVFGSSYSDPDQNQTPSSGAMIIDAALVRPVGFVSMIFGAAAFVVTLPFSLLGQNVGEAAKTLVAYPARTTFVRPLGKF